jgi:chemotaxis protein CheX
MTIHSLSQNTPLAAEFDRDIWTPILALSTREVFQIMLGSRLQAHESAGEPDKREFTALVGLAGSICGVLCLRCSDAAARNMAAKMLGMPAEEVGSDSWDALGEIANMIAGNFKAKLSGAGDRCMLSVPTVIVGTDYATHSLSGGETIEVVLEFEGQALWVTLELHE